jgi:ubiquinol-cytochrome c reductase iron-sulfur subunit
VETPRRRDLLTTVAFATAGVGATLALWPFVAAMNPAEDVRARRVTFDLTKLVGVAPALVDVGQTAVMIFRRTASELSALRNGLPVEGALRDPQSAGSNQPAWAKNWHRSLRPEIMVCLPTCTRGDCIVMRRSADNYDLLCPCCGSHYDLAGRITKGPAQTNLWVPNHHLVSATEIEFAEATIRSTRFSALTCANPA